MELRGAFVDNFAMSHTSTSSSIMDGTAGAAAAAEAVMTVAGVMWSSEL